MAIQGRQHKTDEEIASALIDCSGFITHAAKKLGYKRYQTLSERIEKSDLLQGVIKEIREAKNDHVEAMIVTALANGNLDGQVLTLKDRLAFGFKYLQYHGKDRGYNEDKDKPDEGNDQINIKREIISNNNKKEIGK